MIHQTITRMLDVVILLLLVAILVPSSWFSKSAPAVPKSSVVMQQPVTPAPQERLQPEPMPQTVQSEPEAPIQTMEPTPAPVVTENKAPVIQQQPTQRLTQVKPPAAPIIPKQKMVVAPHTAQSTETASIHKQTPESVHYFKIGAFRQAKSIQQLREIMRQANLPVRLVQKGDMAHFYVGPVSSQNMGPTAERLKGLNLPVIPTTVNT